MKQAFSATAVRLDETFGRALAADRTPIWSIIRVTIGALLLLQALLLVGNLYEFYGQYGLLQGAINDWLLSDPLSPALSWITQPLVESGVAEVDSLYGIYGVYIAALVCVTLGWGTKPALVLALVIHIMLSTSGYNVSYGVDRYTHVAMFYLLLAPCDTRFSLRALRRPRRPISDSTTFRSALCFLLFQAHLAVTYLSAGFEKAAGEQWWNGEAVWYSLHVPDFAQLSVGWMAHVPWLPLVMGWGTLLLECGYPLFVSWRRTRRFWILGIIGMHAGIAVGLGLWFFSATMIALNFCAFILPDVKLPHGLRIQDEGREPAPSPA